MKLIEVGVVELSQAGLVDTGQTEFANYHEYFCACHGFTRLPYQVLEMDDLPGLALNIPVKAPKYERLSGAAIAEAVRATPDPRLFKSVTVIDLLHPDLLWARIQSQDHTILLNGEADAKRAMRLFQPHDGRQTRHSLMCGWWTILHKALPAAVRVFELVTREMEITLLPRCKDPDQLTTAGHWFQLGEALTSDSKEVAAMTAMVNPVRASILGKALGEVLGGVPPELACPDHPFYLELVEFIAVAVRREAYKQLEAVDACDAAEVIRDYLRGTLENCPGCQRNIIRKADGRCPSCQLHLMSRDLYGA